MEGQDFRSTVSCNDLIDSDGRRISAQGYTKIRPAEHAFAKQLPLIQIRIPHQVPRININIPQLLQLLYRCRRLPPCSAASLVGVSGLPKAPQDGKTDY